MRTVVYESAVLINAALDDQQIEAILTRIKELITSNGGEIQDVDDWGRKRLAYPIEKSKIGYYVIFRFQAPSDIVAKLDRAYSLDEQILRYVTLKLDKDAIEQLEKNKTLSVVKEEAVKEAVKETVEAKPEKVEADSESEDNGK